jgi:hypothetical protein
VFPLWSLIWLIAALTGLLITRKMTAIADAAAGL